MCTCVHTDVGDIFATSNASQIWYMALRVISGLLASWPSVGSGKVPSGSRSDFRYGSSGTTSMRTKSRSLM